MDTKLKKKKNAVFIVLAITNLIAMVPYLACAAILPNIMTDLSMSAELTPWVLTIITVISGIMMLLSSVIYDKVGYTNAYKLAIALTVAGTVICAISPNAAVFMAGRIVFAVGFGINCSAVSTLASMWFSGSEFTSFNTASLILSSVGSAVTYMIIFPVISLVGSWQNAYLVFGGLLAIHFLLAFVFIQYPAGVKEGIQAQKQAIRDGLMPKPEFPLGKALKRRNFVMIAVITLLMNTGSAMYQTYMPTYLIMDVGMSQGASSMINSAGIFAGMFGSLVGGFLVAKTGHRKIFQTISCVIFVAFGFVALLFDAFIVVLIGYGMFNIGYYLRQPAISQYLVEEIQPYDPANVSAAVAVTNGIPMLLGMVTSAIASAMIGAGLSYGKTMQIFTGLCIAAIVCSIVMTEVGPKAKKQD